MHYLGIQTTATNQESKPREVEMIESLNKKHLLLIVENKNLASEIHRTALSETQFNKYSKAAGIAVAMTSIIEDLDEWTTWLNHNDFLPLKTADKMVELNKNLSSHLNDIFLHGHFVANDFFETKAKNN
jgi:hypothetical protein